MVMKRQFQLADLEFIELNCGAPSCGAAARLALKDLHKAREVLCPQCGAALCDTRDAQDPVTRLVQAVEELTGRARVEKSKLSLGFRQ